MTIALPVSLFLGTINVGFGISQPNELDIAASQTLKEKMLAVGSQVSNFVILIPNEDHESPNLPKEQRIINQPYGPSKRW